MIVIFASSSGSSSGSVFDSSGVSLSLSVSIVVYLMGSDSSVILIDSLALSSREVLLFDDPHAVENTISDNTMRIVRYLFIFFCIINNSFNSTHYYVSCQLLVLKMTAFEDSDSLSYVKRTI